MTQESDAKLEEKLTCGLENNMRNGEMGTLMGFFSPKLKILSLKFTVELYIMRMKNDAKIEEELTSQFKIGRSNLTNFDSSTQKSQKFAL